MFFGGIFVFAILFAFFSGSFAQNSANFAKAESENPAENSTENSTENSANIYAQNLEIQDQISQNYTVKKLDFINFDGNSYINTKIDQLGDTKIKADFQYDEISPYGQQDQIIVETLFGARLWDGTPDSALGFVVRSNLFNNFAPENIYFRFDYGNSQNNTFQADKLRHQIEVDNNSLKFDGEIIFTQTTAAAPTISREIFLGTYNGDSANTGIRGKIYSFQIFKDEKLVLNLIPAAKIFENGETQYGFVNDLNEDCDLKNDEFFANSGSGILTGGEEISDEKCEILDENANENSEIAQNNSEKTDNSAKILAPATGILARENF